ncbi:MAG: acyl-coenzyme A thioesterase PaaI-like protein [Planctomycetota bacterium]|jgi:acyl-coenzyme A thioesterase PaaI-like protein
MSRSRTKVNDGRTVLSAAIGCTLACLRGISAGGGSEIKVWFLGLAGRGKVRAHCDCIIAETRVLRVRIRPTGFNPAAIGNS